MKFLKLGMVAHTRNFHHLRGCIRKVGFLASYIVRLGLKNE